MNYLFFVAELSHDDGKAYLKTGASSAAAAKNNIQLAESCPESAIRLMEIPRALFSLGAEQLFKAYEKEHFN